MLFASDRPVSVGTMVQLFKGTNVKTKDIKRILEIYQSDLAQASRGVTLEEVVGGYQLRTKVDNADFLKRLTKVRPFKLSGPALEVLAIVAYKQPLIKADIDEIRGVESGHLVRALMEKGLVQFAGKSENPGRPMLYSTTRKFLEIFGLRNLQELPTLSEIDELLPEGIGEEEPEEVLTLGDLADSLAEQTKASYSEGEEDLLKITEKIQSINTASEFFEQEKARMKAQRDLERARDLREALAVGDEVEDKDLRWLQRYELAQEAAAQEAATQEAATYDSKSDLADHEASAAQEEDSGLSEELTEISAELDLGSKESSPEAVTDEELAAFLYSDQDPEAQV